MPDVQFTIKKNDTRPELAIQIIDESTGNPLNLAGATAVFSMKDRSGVLKINRASANIFDAVNGKVKYTWQAADVNTAGIFRGEFEVTFAAGAKATFPSDGDIVITILEDVDNA